MGRGKTKKHPARRPKGSAAVRSGEVRLPKWMMGIGIVGGGFFLALLVWSGLRDGGLLSYVVFGVLTLLSASLIIAPLTEKLTYDPEGFTYRNFFGVSRRYRYTEITDLTVGANNISIYCGDRAVRLSWLYKGMDVFLMGLPAPSRRRREPEQMGIIWRLCYHTGIDILIALGILILLSGTILAMIVFLIYPETKAELKPEDLRWSEVIFQDVEYYNQGNTTEYRLHTQQDDPVYWMERGAWEGIPDQTPMLLRDINQGRTFLVGSLESEAGQGLQRRCVCCIKSAEGNEYLSLDRYNAISQHENKMVLIIMLAAEGALIMVVLATILVGANPEKYPNWAKKVLFKPGALIE